MGATISAGARDWPRSATFTNTRIGWFQMAKRGYPPALGYGARQTGAPDWPDGAAWIRPQARDDRGHSHTGCREDERIRRQPARRGTSSFRDCATPWNGDYGPERTRPPDGGRRRDDDRRDRALRTGLTPERISSWQAAPIPRGRSGMRRSRAASWRDDRNGPTQVVSGPVGRERVHFEEPKADRIESELRLFPA